ncbi:zinc finger protein 3 homolog isoform X2 [Esox lucius]|uniref:C2H2-type domain-containing protein n=1 Tax=Esox lucius TaxID=8010 RepID=A0A3P9AB58_ESOLU|nr:zinc finger protein 3 homolog isoform X2 [Esox lucius]
MSPVKDDFQDISPVTLRLSENTVTSSLYCATAKGLDPRVTSLVESFLVEVYRCRACQYSSSLKVSVHTHILERHDSRAGLPCLEKDDALGMEVGTRGDRENDHGDELDPNGYHLEDHLHSSSKDADEDQMDHMGLERLSFLLPMYGMLPNISPRSCDMALSANSDASLQIAQSCEVSTLFEEERHGAADEEESVFRLDAAGSVNLSCPMGSMAATEPEAKDEEMAQSAHLMTLGLCRISTAKKGPSGRAGTHVPSTPVGQEGLESDTSLDEKMDDKISQRQGQQSAPPGGSKQRWSLSCVLCRATLASKHLLEIHLKCHDGARAFKCLQCGWTSAGWGEMERHWRAHGKRRRRVDRDRGSRPHSCRVCPRRFRSARSRDAHERRYHSQRQECFTCLHCDYSDKSWDRLHKHILSEHRTFRVRLTDTDGRGARVAPASRNLTHEGLYPPDLEGGKPENWCHARKKKEKKRRPKRTNGRIDEEERGEDLGQKKEESVRRRGIKEFCCALCNRKFSTRLTMRRHMGIHQEDKPFECPHCQYSTRLKASLVQHLRVHTGEKPFKCPQCPYASIDSSSLRRHSRTHTQERPYCCPYCPYSSIQKKSLDLHARRHHTGESFPCHLCPYTTPDRQLLLRHALNETD